MTDHKFDSAVQKFVSEQNGDDLTPNIVFDMLRAVDDDGRARYAKLQGSLDSHVKDDKERARIIAKELQDWRDRQADQCADRHRAMFGEIPPVPVRAPRRQSDPPEASFIEDSETGDIRRVYRVAKWALVVVVGGVLVTFADTISRVLSHIFLGYPR
jgi:hypothetical protein